MLMFTTLCDHNLEQSHSSFVFLFYLFIKLLQQGVLGLYVMIFHHSFLW